MKTKKPTHSDVILEMLHSEQLVNPSNVFKVTKKLCNTGCMKLSTRIGELKKQGYKIKTEMMFTKRGNYAFYELINVNKKSYLN